MSTVLATPTISLSGATFWDPLSEVRFEIHRPDERPDLWEAYLEGAETSYRQHGVEHALDLPTIRSGETTEIFIVGIDLEDRVVGGVRFQGPLRSRNEAHIVLEWEGHPGAPTVGRLLDQRIPFGVIEIKSGWVNADSSRRSEITNALARSYVHAMDFLDVRFACCSSAIHSLRRWESSGGKVVSGLRPVPYPDERYQTTLLWWDRQTVHADADAEQWRRIEFERIQLNGWQAGGRHHAPIDTRVACLASVA